MKIEIYKNYFITHTNACRCENRDVSHILSQYNQNYVSFLGVYGT